MSVECASTACALEGWSMVHDDQIYTLTFVSASPAGTGPVQQMEQLYETVIGSFRFIS